MKWLSRTPEPAGPDAVRAAREESGWTLEQAAEAMGMLPVEVAVWEGGRLSEREAAQMRYRFESALYQARLPRPDCEWMRASEARREWLRELDLSSAVRVSRVEQAHARECAECARVQALLRELPAPREPGNPAVPMWIGYPVVVAAALFPVVALGWLLPDLWDFIRRGEELSLAAPLLWACVVWLASLTFLMDPLLEKRPYLAGQLFSAAAVFPSLLALDVLDWLDVSLPGVWIAAALVSVLAGVVTGWWTVEKTRRTAEDARAPEWLEPPPVFA